MRIQFSGDGAHDGAAIPRIVEKILNTPIEAEFRPWRLHGAGKGYSRKVLYAITSAADAGVAAMVATIDCDKARPRERLQAMIQGRDLHRQKHPPFPTALGEAVPSLEAWLLDDREAVRNALALPDNVKVPSVQHARDPKSTLDGLAKQSGFAGTPTRIRENIAERLNPQNCRNPKKTGFKTFKEEVLSEIGPIA